MLLVKASCLDTPAQQAKKEEDQGLMISIGAG
jgi:hypothetical protein